MRKALLIICLVLALPASATAGEIRQLNRDFAVDEQETIRIDVPVAEIQILGTADKAVQIEFTATCKHDRDCKEILEGLDFESHGSRNTLRVDLVGYPKWGKGRLELEGTVRVPKNLEIEIELGVGELEIKELEADLRVELGVGEINAWLIEKKVRAVTLDAGVGEVELYGAGSRLEGRRSMLVGSEVYWDEGPGEGRIFLEVGVGEISAWLE